jgi:hypothetical protein
MELKINNQTNNLHLTALLRPFLTWKFPQTKRNSHRSTIPLSQNKIVHYLNETDDILIISTQAVNQAARAGYSLQVRR